MNETENHHGFQYCDGLNILDKPLSVNPDYFPHKDGFHFTDYKHIPYFIDRGVYIREVTIPKDAQVIKMNSFTIWRTDKIILSKKYHIKRDFDKWFDPKKYNWHETSWILAVHFPEYFDKWFDPEKYNYYDVWALAKFCSDKFDKWFFADKIDWKHNILMFVQYCPQYFDRWYNPDYVEWETDSWALAQDCSEYFDKWFDPQKFNWKYAVLLARHCPQHREKWEQYLPDISLLDSSQDGLHYRF